MIDLLNLNPEYFGIDISDLSLKIVKLRKNKHDFDLVSFAEREIPKGVIDSGEIKDETVVVKIIKEALAEIVGKKIKTKYVVSSLPEEKSYLQIIQIPKMQEEEIKNAIRFEAENHIPLPLNDVYFDFQTVKPLCENVDHVDVLIAATPKSVVDSHVSAIEKSGLYPLATEIERLSITRALIKEESSPFPVLLIDFGGTRTSFIIFSGNSIRFTSSFQTSSQDLTIAIAAAMKVDLPKAEEIKRKYGISGLQKISLKEKTGDSKFEMETQEDTKFLSIVKPVLDNLIDEIRTLIEYYHAHFKDDHLPSNAKNVEKIILCGGGANLKGLPEFLTNELKIKTEIGNPRINIKKIPPLLSEEKSLSFTTAIGLAQRKIDL